MNCGDEHLICFESEAEQLIFSDIHVTCVCRSEFRPVGFAGDLVVAGFAFGFVLEQLAVVSEECLPVAGHVLHTEVILDKLLAPEDTQCSDSVHDKQKTLTDLGLTGIMNTLVQWPLRFCRFPSQTAAAPCRNIKDL